MKHDIPTKIKNHVRRHGGRVDGVYKRLDHLENISLGVRFLYLLSSRSEPPIGDSRDNNVRLLLPWGLNASICKTECDDLDCGSFGCFSKFVPFVFLGLYTID